MEKGQLRQVSLKDTNLKNVHTVSNMLRTLQTHIVKRLAKAFKEWNNYIILKKIIDKEKSLQITRKLESFIFSVCQDVRDLLDSDRCSLWLMDVESQKLWAQQGDGVGTAMHVSLSGNSHVADCARKKSAVLVKCGLGHDGNDTRPRFHMSRTLHISDSLMMNSHEGWHVAQNHGKPMSDLFFSYLLSVWGIVLGNLRNKAPVVHPLLEGVAVS